LSTIIKLPVRLNETQLGAIGRQNLVPLRAVTPDLAEIRISNRPLTIDLVQRYIDEGEENMMPAVLKQFKDKYKFYIVEDLKATLQMKAAYARGAKDLHLEGLFLNDHIIIEDVAPKTEWVPKNGSISFALDINSQILSLIPIPLPGVEPKVQFKYNWNPKVARIISGGTNQEAFWLFRGAEYRPRIDGDNQLTISFRTPAKLNVDKVSFRLKGTAKIDLQEEPDDVAIQSTDVEIELP
jgi:hypothetical protein